MRKQLILAVVFFLTGVLGCKKSAHDENSSEPKKVYQVQELGKDFFVPSKIWDVISGTNLTQVQETGSVVFLPIKVRFREKNPGVLNYSDQLFDFPKGGGDLDLSLIKGSQIGTFFLSFEFEGFNQPDELKVFFVNTARKTKIDGEVRGDGCDRAYDLKNFILSTLKTGIEVNTYKDQHLYLLGGHFIFATKVKNQVLVSKVTFFDSTKSYAFCENFLLKKRAQEGQPSGV